MSSRLGSPKERGQSVEAAVIDACAALRPIGDSEAEWYDAETVGLLEPSYERPFYGIPVVESGTPVEVKGACVVTGNGDRDTAGRWYVRRAAHEQLLDAGGVYLLAVYAPKPETPVLREAVVPASLLDEHLAGSWYSVDGERSEDEVAKLAWPTIIDRERVPGSLGVSADV